MVCFAAIRAGKRVQDFWSELPKATISDDGKILSLVNNTFFLGSMDYGDKLLIRKCYFGLLDTIRSHFQENCRGVVIIGNPGKFPLCQTNLFGAKSHSKWCFFVFEPTGIGKSMMSYLMLYRASTGNTRVVFRKAGWKGEQAHLFCADGVFELNHRGFQRELERSDVL